MKKSDFLNSPKGRCESSGLFGDWVGEEFWKNHRIFSVKFVDFFEKLRIICFCMDTKKDSRIPQCGSLPDLSKERMVVGAKQLRKALASGRAQHVFLAENADPAVTEPLEALCRNQHVNHFAIFYSRFNNTIGFVCHVIIHDIRIARFDTEGIRFFHKFFTAESELHNRKIKFEFDSLFFGYSILLTSILHMFFNDGFIRVESRRDSILSEIFDRETNNEIMNSLICFTN